MLIDTHIHLDAPEFDLDRAAVLLAARQAGVQHFIVPGVARDNFAAVQALATDNPDVSYALGIHPLYVAGARPEDLEQLDAALAQGGAVAVGEIGLDHFVPDRDEALQEAFFVAQLKLARKHDLPVILHVRRAVDAILKQLRRYPVQGGIAHAFNGSVQQAEQFIALGFKLGFGGAMTYSGSRRIRSLAAALPLSALVLETDAPDIQPAWSAGGRTEPMDILRYAQILAGLRNISVAEVIAVTGENARQVLNLG